MNKKPYLSHVGLLLPVDRPGVPGEVEHLHSALRALLPHPLMNLKEGISKNARAWGSLVETQVLKLI